MGVIVKEMVAAHDLPARWRQQLGTEAKPDGVVQVTLELMEIGTATIADAKPRSERVLAGIRRSKGVRPAADIVREDRDERDRS